VIEMGLRVGLGYDVHKLTQGRKLIMGGVEIPHELGLLGHSDADVLIHAIMDALLGAAKMGDIGKLFPDTDPKYKGISSITLLKCVKEKMDEKGIKVVNIDSIIVAQKPKMRPYIEQMEKNIAQALDCDVDLINVKATTEEELGFTGRKEGIASKAVCLIEC
jgi:2-C-methyl-D-erythritol 2,4-cyclodiphosphate synthase